MSEPESFLSRWSRRKAESGERQVSPAEPAPADGEAKPNVREGSPASPPVTGEPAADFDPASLPPIESIAAGADIRPFLQSGVPAELMRAALRRAWTTDPAICDFVGIAENQWDFNDPTAMPGFGPLTAADRAATLAAQMPGGASGRAGPIAEASIAAAPAKPEAGVEAAPPPALAEKGPADGETVGLAAEGCEGKLAGGDDGAPNSAASGELVVRTAAPCPVSLRVEAVARSLGSNDSIRLVALYPLHRHAGFAPPPLRVGGWPRRRAFLPCARARR